MEEVVLTRKARLGAFKVSLRLSVFSSGKNTALRFVVYVNVPFSFHLISVCSNFSLQNKITVNSADSIQDVKYKNVCL